MAKEEINLKITATDQASKVIDPLIKKVEKLDGTEAELGLKADDKKAQASIKDFIKSVEKIDGETATMALAVKGADVQAKLGDLLVDISKLDASDVTIDVKLAEAASLKSDLNDIETAVRKLDSEVITPRVDTSNLDHVHRAAGDTADTLQRGIGPLRGFTDELGGTSQVAGTMSNAMIDAGEAVQIFGSQLGFSEATLGKISGAMAGLGIAVGIGIAAWSAFNKQQKESEKATKEASAAIEEELGLLDRLKKGADLGPATTAVEEFNRSLIADKEDRENAVRSLGAINKAGSDLGQVMVDLRRDSQGALTGLGEQAGIPKEWAAAIADAVDGSEDFIQVQDRLFKTFGQRGEDVTKTYRKQIQALLDLQAQQKKTNPKEAAQQALDFAAGIDAGTKALVDQATATARGKDANADAIAIFDEYVKLEGQQKTNAEGAAKATEAFATSQENLAGAIDGANTALDDQIKALEDLLDAAKTGADLGITLEKAEEGLTAAVQARKDALEATKKAVTPEDQKKAHDDYIKSLEDERDAVIDAGKAQQEYREVQAVAQGVQLSATQKVDGMNDSLEEMAKRAGPEAQKSVYNYLIQLNEIPEEKQTAIYAAVDAGKLDEANVLIDEASKTREVALNVDVDTTDAMRKIAALGAFIRQQFAGTGIGEAATILDAGGTAGRAGGIAGERGPEILNDRYLVSGATYIPPGTRVTSRRRTEQILRTRGTRGLKRYDAGGVVPRNTSVTINAAVIGSTFDVMNAVTDAVRRAERLMPRHQ